jgi:hypothetical protein
MLISYGITLLHYYIITLDDLLNTSTTKIAGSHGNITSPKGF